MLVMFTTRRRRCAGPLAILIAACSAIIPTDAIGDGRLTSGLEKLIAEGRDQSLDKWQADLAELCTTTIRVGGSDDPIVFKARPVTELLVHYQGSLDQFAGLWADSVLFRDDRLKYLVVRIPTSSVAGSFERDLRNLQGTPGVRVVEPRCLPARGDASEGEEGPCASPNELANALDHVAQTRDAAACDGEGLDKNREAIGLSQLLKSPAGKTTLVAVIDVGFDQFDLLVPALSKVRYNKDGSLTEVVNGWDYCENDASIDGGLHGTQISGLVGASCAQFSDAPGISQSSLIVGMQTFFDNGNNTRGFAGPEALAAAIQDAQSIGARVVNMSFWISSGAEDGWTAVRTAMEQASDVVFVTGPWEDGELPFPGRLQTDNMILVGTRAWTANGDELIAWTSGSSLHIDAPWAGKLVIPPNLSGTSNAIAYVSGAVADLLGRPGCESLTPAKAREILVKNGATASDDDAKPLLQVGFLGDPNCP